MRVALCLLVACLGVVAQEPPDVPPLPLKAPPADDESAAHEPVTAQAQVAAADEAREEPPAEPSAESPATSPLPPSQPPAPVPPPPPPPLAPLQAPVDQAALVAEAVEEPRKQAEQDEAEAAREATERETQRIEDESRGAARKGERGANLAELAERLAEDKPDPESVQHNINNALETGATTAEVAAGRQFLQGVAIKKVEKHQANPQDGLPFVYQLVNLINDASRQGAMRTQPQMAAAWHTYETMICAEIVAAVNDEDLAVAFDVLQHMRTHDRAVLQDTCIGPNEGRLHTMAMDAVNLAETLAKTDRARLAQAIRIVQAEGLDVDVSKAEELRNYEERKDNICQGITVSIEEGNTEDAIGWLQAAGDMGIEDEEAVKSAREQLQAWTRQKLKESVPTSAPSGPNGIVSSASEARMQDSDLHRTLKMAQGAGLKEEELLPLKELLAERVRQKLEELKAKPFDESQLFWEMDELTTTARNELLSEEERKAAKVAVDQKMVNTLKAKTLHVNGATLMLGRLASNVDNTVEQATLEEETARLKADLLEELMEAAAALDTGGTDVERLSDGVEAADRLVGIADMLHVAAGDVAVALGGAVQKRDLASKRRDSMEVVSDLGSSPGLKRLEEAVEDCRAAACSTEQLAPFEQMIQDRKSAISAARAKILAALSLAAVPDVGGRRVSAGAAAPKKEEVDVLVELVEEDVQAELAPLREVYEMMLKDYPDLVADGDEYLDRLSSKIEKLEGQLNSLS